jgi:hypothetical protein
MAFFTEIEKILKFSHKKIRWIKSNFEQKVQNHSHHTTCLQNTQCYDNQNIMVQALKDTYKLMN